MTGKFAAVAAVLLAATTLRNPNTPDISGVIASVEQ